MEPAAPKTAELPLARDLIRRPGVLIAAHRGASRMAPENTLPAFEKAVQLGADLVELDYMRSADGVLVVFHDATLDRTTNMVRRSHQRNVKLDTKTLAELRELDAGSWFHPRFAATTIPSLEEAVDLISRGATPLLERKAGSATISIELLKRKRLLDRAIVMAFDWTFLAECHRLAPELTLVALGDRELQPVRLDDVPPTGASVVGWDQRYLTADGIAEIHRRGWKAWAWTVDDVARGRQLQAAGIDCITTNVPDVMLSLKRHAAADETK